MADFSGEEPNGPIESTWLHRVVLFTCGMFLTIMGITTVSLGGWIDIFDQIEFPEDGIIFAPHHYLGYGEFWSRIGVMRVPFIPDVGMFVVGGSLLLTAGIFSFQKKRVNAVMSLGAAVLLFWFGILWSSWIQVYVTVVIVAWVLRGKKAPRIWVAWTSILYSLAAYSVLYLIMSRAAAEHPSAWLPLMLGLAFFGGILSVLCVAREEWEAFSKSVKILPSTILIGLLSVLAIALVVVQSNTVLPKRIDHEVMVQPLDESTEGSCTVVSSKREWESSPAAMMTGFKEIDFQESVVVIVTLRSPFTWAVVRKERYASADSPAQISCSLLHGDPHHGLDSISPIENRVLPEESELVVLVVPRPTEPTSFEISTILTGWDLRLSDEEIQLLNDAYPLREWTVEWSPGE